MNTYREIVYMILDKLKLNSDDSFFTEDHILYLVDKYRNFVLEKKYIKNPTAIADSNYQTINIEFEEVPVGKGNTIHYSNYRSKEKIPSLFSLGNVTIYGIDPLKELITYITPSRMKYVGYNKYMQSIIYGTKADDDYFYIKSNNPQYKMLKGATIEAIFENPTEASQLNGEFTGNIMDMEFPLEKALIPELINTIMQELSASVYLPEDTQNNAKDDLSDAQRPKK